MSLARLSLIGLVVAGLISGSSRAWAQDVRPMPMEHAEGALSDEADRIHDSLKVLTELSATPDNAIPKHLLERADAIVVIPSLDKSDNEKFYGKATTLREITSAGFGGALPPAAQAWKTSIARFTN